MGRASFIGGVGLYLFLILFGFLYEGGHLLSLVHPSALIVVSLAPWTVLCTAYGARGAFRHLRAALRGQAPDIGETQRFLSLWIASVYGTSAILFILDLVVLAGFLAGEPWKIGEKAVVSLIPFLFGLFLAEGMLRPLRHRLTARG